MGISRAFIFLEVERRNKMKTTKSKQKEDDFFKTKEGKEWKKLVRKQFKIQCELVDISDMIVLIKEGFINIEESEIPKKIDALKAREKELWEQFDALLEEKHNLRNSSNL